MKAITGARPLRAYALLFGTLGLFSVAQTEPRCTPVPFDAEEHCYNGLDDDQDGLLD